MTPFFINTHKTGWVTGYLLAIDSHNLCPKTFQDSVYVDRVIADFTIDTNEACAPGYIQFFGTSSGGNKYLYNFGDGGTYSNGLITDYTYVHDGVYDPVLIAIDSLTMCADTADTTITIHPLPNIGIVDNQVICIGDSVLLTANGGESYAWWPDVSISSLNTSSVWVYPKVSQDYYVLVTDLKNCEAIDSVNVYVQQIPSLDSFPSDTILFIGQNFIPTVLSGFQLNYSWWPDNGVDCPDCANPTFEPGDDQTYTLTYSDLYGCFTADSSFTIERRNRSFTCHLHAKYIYSQWRWVKRYL